MELPKRKNVRLAGFDYQTAGAYFITICVKDRKPILGKIVGTGLPAGPKNILSQYGEIAEKVLINMSDFYDNIKLDKYAIMPNHIHLLLQITESGGPSRTPVPTNSPISKFVGTFKRFCNKEYGGNVWQARSYDHVIRGQEDYAAVWEYIENNHLKWEEDELYKKAE